MKNNLEEMKKSIGYCDQHNILYNNLTVFENLELIAAMKGMKIGVSKNEIDKIIHKVL